MNRLFGAFTDAFERYLTQPTNVGNQDRDPLGIHADIENEIEIPEFLSPESENHEKKKEKGNLSLEIPVFSDHPHCPIEDKWDELQLEMPLFTSPHLPETHKSEGLSLKLPLFLDQALPEMQKPKEKKIDLPIFSSPSEPSSVHIPMQMQLDLPTFLPLPQPKISHAPTPNIVLPILVSPVEPCSSILPLSTSLRIPQFSAFAPPKIKKIRQKALKMFSDIFQHHPVMKNFEKSIRLKPYAHILQDAVNLGSVSDIRILKKQGLLEKRYLNLLFKQFNEEASSLLPRSSNFHILLENDQEQLDHLSQFCMKLISIDRWEDLKPHLNHNSIIDHLIHFRPSDSEHSQKELLQFKNFIYCFLFEILLQEKKAAQQFCAIKKDLIPLAKALSVLQMHIESQTEAWRMKTVRLAAKLEFSPWEDRVPLPSPATKLENPGKEVSLQALQAGLSAIQSQKPKAWQLKDFIDQVLSLPESNHQEVCHKAKYLIALGQVYLKLPVLPALKLPSLKRALSWIDLAIITLNDHVVENDPALLECYELRGAIWLEMAEFLKIEKNNNTALLRKWIDASYRDFHFSSPLEQKKERNFVRKAQEAKKIENIDTALAHLSETIEMDADYAEARYIKFLRQFEKERLDSTQVLHDQFKFLRKIHPTQTFEAFHIFLQSKVHQKNNSLFKITLDSGIIYLKMDSRNIFISQSGIDVLMDMLIHGVKKIRTVHPSKKKIYFCEPISKKQFCDAIHLLVNDEKRLKEIEQGIHAFHAFEIAACYRSTLLDSQEELTRNSIQQRVDPNLIMAALNLEIMTMHLLFQMGKNKSLEQSKEHFTTAILYACRAIHRCDRLLADADNSLIRTKKIDLIIKRAMIYHALDLGYCYVSDLEEAIALSKKENSRFLNPSLHYALGCAYQELNRFEEAKEQFLIVKSAQAVKKTKAIVKKANKKLLEIEQDKREKKNAIPPDQDITATLTEFQDRNIQQECLQILRNHYLANSSIHPHRTIPLWTTFMQQIDKTTTTKEFCETVISFVLISEKVKPENLYRIVKLANILLKDLKDLDQLKAYVLDTSKTYAEEEARLHDAFLNRLEEAKAAVVRAEAFAEFKKKLIDKLKEGELIRPGSATRQKMTDLSSYLIGFETDHQWIIRSLTEIIGEAIDPNLEIIIQDISEILENALEIETSSPKIKDHVLEIYGNNIFLSQIKQSIEKLCSQNGEIYDVHIMGIHVYIDTTLALHGKNLAIGGQYIEFLLDKGMNGRQNPPQLISIHLSGKKGNDSTVSYAHAASRGNHPCDDGSDGKLGGDGDGGQPGGDFCIITEEPIAGIANIQEIHLHGGNGGTGSKGQDGGNGACGIAGTNARTDIRDGDPADTCWGHIDFRYGTKGRVAGSGGRGGDGGMGGKGGLSGRLLIEKIPDNLNALVKVGNGKEGENGDPGKGGKGGKGKPDGFDYGIIKGGLFSSQHKFWCMQPYCKNGKKDRDKDSWADGITFQQTITRNQGKEKGRGKSKEELTRSRREQRKHDLKRELFATNLGHHLHTQSAANKAGAFDEVTNHLAVVRATEEVVQEQLILQQKKLKDIETLVQTTANLLHQTQTQHKAQAQHSRVANFTKTKKEGSQKKEIEAFFNSPERDKENKLPFHECSPILHQEKTLIIHDVERAIHEVNTTQAQNMLAIAKLFREITHIPDEIPIIQENRNCLLNKLAQIIQDMPLKFAMHGFDQAQKDCKDLEYADELHSSIAKKALAVENFRKQMDEEKKFLNTHYETDAQDLLVKASITRFLSQDRLLYFLLVKNANEEELKKWRWFNERLLQKVDIIINQRTQHKPSQEMIDFYLAYAHQQIKHIQSKKGNKDKAALSKLFKKNLATERKQLQGKLKNLRFEQEWMLEHLPELFESNISPKQLLEKSIVTREKLYSYCCQKWTNISSFSEESFAAQPFIPPSENLNWAEEWMAQIRKKDWNSQKLTQLESQFKQLMDMEKELGDLKPYLEQLKFIYSQSDEYHQLAGIFISLVRHHRNLNRCLMTLKALMANTSKKVSALKKKYQHHIKNPSDSSLEINLQVFAYLQNRHIFLTKKECIEQLIQREPSLAEKRNELDSLLNDLFFKVNQLYRFHNYLPHVDFLSLSQEMMSHHASRIRENLFAKPIDDPQIPHQQEECVDKQEEIIEPDFMHLLLEKSVGLGPLNLNDHASLIHSLDAALREENHQKKVGAYLFLLSHLDLSYAHHLQIIKILDNPPFNTKPLINQALTSFVQKANEQKIKFDIQWEAVLERARFYDQLLQIFDKEGADSVEWHIIQIAQEANLLTSSDEKIEILNQLKKIIEEEGCFSSIPRLKSLQDQRIAKMGRFPILENEMDEKIQAYHQGLDEAYDSSEKNNKYQELPTLLMQVLHEKPFCQTFLSPCFIAIHHFPFTDNQLIMLYQKIDSLDERELNENQKEIKQVSLNKIKDSLINILQTDAQKKFDAQTKIKADLQKRQMEIEAKLTEVLNGSQILYPERYCASVELWFKLLDIHYEIDDVTDEDGKKRQALYQEVLDKFLEEINSSNIETAMTHFHQWLRHRMNQLKGKAADQNTLVALLANLDQTKSEEIRQQAFNQLKTLYWRGIMPYSGSENSILERLEGQQLNEETAALLKLKFDDAMILEECYQVKKRLDSHQQKAEENVTKRIDGIQKKLLSENIPREKIEAIYFQKEEELNLIHNPASEDKQKEEAIPASDEKSQIVEADLHKIHEYLNGLEERIKKGKTSNDDAILLNGFKTLLKEQNQKEFSPSLEKIGKLELQLIAYNDQKNKLKNDKIDFLLEKLSHDDRASKKSSHKNLQDPFFLQHSKDIHQLKNALSSCAVFMGEETFMELIDKFINYLETYRKPMNLQMLAHIFWVCPRLNHRALIEETLKKRLPENWATTLLEAHCIEAFTPFLSEMIFDLPSLNLSHLSIHQKDEVVNKALKEREKKAQETLTLFKEILKQLISTSHLNSRNKELLLRLIADRLTLLSQGKLKFSIEDFTDLIANYMVSPCVLKKLAAELPNPHSPITQNLFRPSFESFKHALTLAWMQGVLDPFIAADRQKLFDSLFEIETMKKKEKMQEVVESLQGNFITPAVVECVSNFARGVWELDKETLTLLKNRTASGEWYADIERYTKTKRSLERDLKTLVKLMDQESTGINRSIANLLTGEEPALMQDILDIKKDFEDTVSHWSEEDITQWARESKGEHFLDDPQRLKRGIAVVSRANQLIEKKKNPRKDCKLRDTQLLAIWLMLRKGEDEEKGRISQMFTGEGKSITFASIAILKAMTKSHVDVITTSFILAERDAITKKELFDLFELTVSNNCDVECESDEEVRKERYFRDGKPVDIVYGDVASFERDLLLTEFHGKEIIHKSRMGPNRAALVDEVDGLFLDSAGMVLYLSHNVDTLRFLEKVFVHIWTLANQPSFERASPFNDQAVEAIAKMMKAKLDSDELPLPKYEIPHAKYMEMKAIIERKLPIWIRSALHAKILRANNEYIITDQIINGKKKKAITVMDKGTGVEQMSLKWSNGLHPFLQLKHGLEPSSESLKAVFLSNYFFFKRYAQHLYGLSGTLGSDAEQKYLQDLYQVNLCKIPRFKGEKFILQKPTICGDREEWADCIKKKIQYQTQELKRGVLLICESVEEVMFLKEKLKDDYPLLQTYTSSFQELSFLSHDHPTPVGPGDLIIATNLAGRGTDLGTTSLLEAHGGLHVILSFLPPNIRIEEQNLGRTARAGNEGSGEFIILDSQRRSFTEQCRVRDFAEKQRLESVALKEVKKIEFENELLRGFYYKGEKIPGFQSLLDSIKESLQNEEEFYREAQLDSLKNRWAFWIDHMDEKISMVYAIGKATVIESFKKFQAGVQADFHAGGFRLIKEPIELIKLGGEYRRKEMWSEAENCYAEAAKDPQYEYARYYKAACQLIRSPSSSLSAKKAFKEEAKKAARSIKPEISQLQTAVQNTAPLIEQRRLKFGEADLGNPYKTRSEEKIQIWSIFLSAIDSAIGGNLSEENLRKSPFVKGNDAGQILESLGNHYKPIRISKKLAIDGDTTSYKGKTLNIPKMFKPVMPQINGMKKIDKQLLKGHCNSMVTQESAKQLLNCNPVVVYKLNSIPPSFENWPPEYSEATRFVLSAIIDECKYKIFHTQDDLKAEILEKKQSHAALQELNLNAFFDMLRTDHFIVEDFKIDLSGKFIKNPPLKFPSLKNVREGFTDEFTRLPEALQEALFNACREREAGEAGVQWFLNPSIYLGDLSLPKNTEDAVDMLWTLLEEQQVIKPSKIHLEDHDFKKQTDKIKERLSDYFKGNEKMEEAVDSVFEIIESSFGMIHKLDDKKTTAKFADIIRKYYHDHQQHAPEGLGTFIELGLEVIADLVEKKDPPAWYEVLAVTVMGVVQMVAGVIIKAYLPVVGELIGNALISSGMDDVMFAITSAVNGEFSWDDYAEAKVASLKRSIISSAITCGISFGVSAVQLGGVDKAWEVQKLSGVDKAIQAGQLAPGSFNLGTHVLKEVGRSFIGMGISQLASRGLEGMTKLIAGSYEGKVREGVERAVNGHWHLVETQAKALHSKLNGDESSQGVIQQCIEMSLKQIQETNAFEGAIRASKQVLPQASSLIGNSGWSTFVSHAPDLANLGVSISKLVNLVEDNVHQLSRRVREAKERKDVIAAPKKVADDAFSRNLEEKKSEYTKQLIDAFNGILNSGVYAPLVSMGTQYLMEKGKQALIPEYNKDNSNEVPESEKDDLPYSDEDVSKWGEMNQEVTKLTDEEYQMVPMNSDETLEVLQLLYGDHLRVYKDKEGHLYVQRPSREEFAASINEDEQVGDPALVALTHVVNKKIAVKSSDGTSVIYSPDGEITPLQQELADDILTLDKSSMKDYKTLSEALRCSGIPIEGDPMSLKNDIAATLLNNEDCKRFYHDQSLTSEFNASSDRLMPADNELPACGGPVGFMQWHHSFIKGFSHGFITPIGTIDEMVDRINQPIDSFPTCSDSGPMSFYDERNAYALGQGVGLVAGTGKKVCEVLDFFGVSVPLCQPLKRFSQATESLAITQDRAQGRRKNFLQANPEKTGQHRVSIRDSEGKVIRYAIYKPNPYVKGKWIEVKRYDPIESSSHGNIPAPHVHLHGERMPRTPKNSEMTLRDRQKLGIKLFED